MHRSDIVRKITLIIAHFTDIMIIPSPNSSNPNFLPHSGHLCAFAYNFAFQYASLFSFSLFSNLRYKFSLSSYFFLSFVNRYFHTLVKIVPILQVQLFNRSKRASLPTPTKPFSVFLHFHTAYALFLCRKPGVFHFGLLEVFLSSNSSVIKLNLLYAGHESFVII